MSKSIKVSEEVYRKLRIMQATRESYSDTIARLLKMSEVLDAAIPFLKTEGEVLRAKLKAFETEKTDNR